MSCSANIKTIIDEQKKLIDTIDNYNYYVFCAKVGNEEHIGNNGSNASDVPYDFDKYDNDDEEANSVHTSGTYKLHNEWPQSLIEIKDNLRTGCQNSDLKGLTPTNINAQISTLQGKIVDLEDDNCSDKIQEIRDKHIELMNKKQQVLNLTAQYESDPSSMLKQSELQLDSTIYASILWSTVAAGLLYYVFVDI